MWVLEPLVFTVPEPAGGMTHSLPVLPPVGSDEWLCIIVWALNTGMLSLSWFWIVSFSFLCLLTIPSKALTNLILCHSDKFRGRWWNFNGLVHITLGEATKALDRSNLWTTKGPENFDRRSFLADLAMKNIDFRTYFLIFWKCVDHLNDPKNGEKILYLTNNNTLKLQSSDWARATNTAIHVSAINIYRMFNGLCD